MVRSGTTWEVDAWWGQNDESFIYPVFWDGIVEVTEPGEIELTIGGIVEMNETALLPIVFR